MRELLRGSFSSGSLTSQGSMGDVHTSEEGHSQAQAGQLLPEALRAVLAVLVSQYSQDKTRLPVRPARSALHGLAPPDTSRIVLSCVFDYLSANEMNPVLETQNPPCSPGPGHWDLCTCCSFY